MGIDRSPYPQFSSKPPIDSAQDFLSGIQAGVSKLFLNSEKKNAENE